MRTILAVAAAILLPPCGAASAQIWNPAPPPADTTRIRPELRLDYLGASTQALHVGAGISVPAGTYARVGIAAGAGPGWGNGTFTSARVDLTGRFLIDPFRRARWGVSLGGGIGMRYDAEGFRGVALLLADVEGPGRRGWIPFAGAGIGGGVRITAGLRRAATIGR